MTALVKAAKALLKILKTRAVPASKAIPVEAKPNSRPLRILVCGGRDFMDRELVFQILDLLLPVCVITGGADGADKFAHLWATTMNVYAPQFFADWNEFGKAAGPIRNALMLKDGKPDLVLAFPGGRVTADLARRARARGVPIITVVPPIYWDEHDEGDAQLAMREPTP